MKKNLFILLLSIVIISGCSQQKDKSKGPYDVIYILSSETTREKIQTSIDTCFSNYGINTPSFQPYFYTRYYTIDKFQVFAKYKNLVVVADLNEDGIGTEIAESLLPESQYKLALNDSVNIFSINDAFARDQIFILIAGKDFNKINNTILHRKNWIYSKFNKIYNNRAKKIVYNRREQKNLTRHIFDKYKWTFRVPKKFITLKELPENNFVWMGTAMPYRWISINWEEGLHTELMTANGLMTRRQIIGDYYDGIKADTTMLSHYFTKFNELDALRMNGLWFSETDVKGGPFITYSFYDGFSDRTFVIDLLLFEPSEKITDFFRQLDITAKTFTTQFSEEIFKD